MSERRHRILLIEDDPNLPELLRTHMESLEYEVTLAVSGQEGLSLARAQAFDVLIVDYNLPEISGIEIIKRLREEGKTLPILMLTSRTEELDKVLGLNAGADDYLTKPFSLAELLARVAALIRRGAMSNAAAEAVARRVFGPLVIEPELRRVLLQGKEVELTSLEFELIEFMSRSPGRPFDRAQLLENVWGTSVLEYEYSLTSVVARLRKKIEAVPSKPRFILTVRGVGYRFARAEELLE